MNWTPDRIEILRTMATDGRSASEAGVELGITRNAVLGKANRNGIRFASAHHGPRKPRQRAKAKISHPIAPQPDPIPASPPAPARACSLLELTNETCRYPIAPEGEPYVACGALDADMSDGMPYCRVHARIAYRRPGEREAA